MGYSTRQKMKLKQAKRRRKKRDGLIKNGQNPDEVLFSGVWVGPRKSS